MAESQPNPMFVASLIAAPCKFDAESEVIAIVAAAHMIAVFDQRRVRTILRCHRRHLASLGITRPIL